MITSIEEFVKLVESNDIYRNDRIRTETVAQDILLRFVKEYPQYRRVVTINKNLPVDVLLILANDEDPNVRFDIAMKRRISVEIMELLAKDKSESVRERIAWNAKTPIEILKVLEKDVAPRVAETARRRLNDKSYRKADEPDG